MLQTIKSISVFFLLTLIIRVATALPQTQPHNMDEAYHTVNAQTLTRGDGFTEHFIWNYLNPPESVSHPGNLYWMPLTSLIARVGMAIGGPTFSAGQLGFILLSALLPPLGYGIAWRFNRNRRHALIVALLMLFSGFYFPVWTAIDTFTPFALAGIGCLAAAWQMTETKRYRWAALAGIAAGLAHLTRADGLLLLVAIVLGLLIIKPRLSLKRIVLLFGVVVAGYGLVMAPWFWRNIQVTGSAFPPGGSKTLWLQSYNDIFSYGQDLSWRSYLAWGLWPILQSKLWAAWINFQTLFAVQGLIIAFPLAIIGWWQQRWHPLFQIATIYTALLLAAMTLAFTFPGPRGALFHSGGAILPFVFLAAIIGLDAAIGAVARRRKTWRIRSARQVFGAALVIFAVLISGFATLRKIDTWQTADAVYPQIARQLNAEPATVMVGNPPAYLYHGGYQAIVIPNEPLEIVLTVADRYGASYLILDANHPAPLKDLYLGTVTSPRLALEAEFDGPTYLYRIEPDP